jgi:hypothetical protein
VGAIDRRYPVNLNMKERRQLWRFPFDLDVSLWPKTGSSQQVRLLDLSVDGAGIVITRPVDPGTTGVLRIDLPQGAALRLPYKVLWSQTINGLKRSGLRMFMIDSVKIQLATWIDGVTGG